MSGLGTMLKIKGGINMKPIVDLIWNPEDLPYAPCSGSMSESCLETNCGDIIVDPPEVFPIPLTNMC